MEHFAGLDVSMEATAVCVVDGSGTVVREGKCASEPEALVGWLQASGVGLSRVGLEAGPLSGWLWAGLRAAGLPARCLETRRLRGMTQALPVKTDRLDARAIAQAVRCGLYREVHVKSAASQEVRLLLTSRQQLLRLRVELDNGLRGTLKSFGLRVGKVGPAGFAERVLQLMAERETLLAVVRPMLAARAELERQFAVLDKQLRQLVRHHAVCRRLMTVPGVGPVASLAYVTALDDPSRFRRSREVGAYLGLIPRRYQSGELDRHGHISKAGDVLARETLFLAAHTLLTRVRRYSALKAWGMAVAKRRGLRRATVAVARRLAVLLHRIWVDGTQFRWSKTEPVA
jgi:transposase